MNQEDDLGRSPLLAACEKGHHSCVQIMLRAGADVGSRPLNLACERGHIECAELLLAAGADANEGIDGCG